MTTFDFSLIAQAGITQLDVADYLGVSRVTINYWVQGHVAAITPEQAVDQDLAEAGDLEK